MKLFNYKDLGIKNTIDLITFILGFLFCLNLLYQNFFSMLEPLVARSSLVGTALLIVFLRFPFSKKNPILRWAVDGPLLGLILFCYGHIFLTGSDLVVYRLGGLLSKTDLLVYLPGTLFALEATRRATGWPFTIVAGVFLVYAHWGHLIPGYFSHSYLSYGRVAEAVFLNVDGLFGATTMAMIEMIWFFLIFGAFLEVTGAGRAFIEFAFSLTGRRRGGAGQAAVLASLLYGFVSGSGVASVATMGTFTIPLMKSGGYKDYFAGGVESAAAMGAQVTPPVMGGTAFLISAVIGVTYLDICKASLMPAFLYFFCIACCLYFEAGRLGLLGLPREQVPKLDRGRIMRAFVPLSSIGMMVVILVMGYTPRVAAVTATFWLIIVGAIYREMKMNPAIFLKGLAEGFNSGASLAAILATAGVCVAVVTSTGVGMKFTALVVEIGHIHLAFAIFIIMVAAVFLGMGLPTPAVYIILAVLAGPALTRLGAPALEAHLLIFYYGVFAGLTPPVGIAFMTAAAIAGAKTFQTGVAAVRIAIVGLILPFIWIYMPSLLLKGSLVEIFWTYLTSLVGIVGLALVNIGYSINKRLKIWERILFFAISIPLIFSSKGYLAILIFIFGLLFYLHHYGFTLVPIGNFFKRKRVENLSTKDIEVQEYQK